MQNNVCYIFCPLYIFYKIIGLWPISFKRDGDDFISHSPLSLIYTCLIAIFITIWAVWKIIFLLCHRIDDDIFLITSTLIFCNTFLSAILTIIISLLYSKKRINLILKKLSHVDQGIFGNDLTTVYKTNRKNGIIQFVFFFFVLFFIIFYKIYISKLETYDLISNCKNYLLLIISAMIFQVIHWTTLLKERFRKIEEIICQRSKEIGEKTKNINIYIKNGSSVGLDGVVTTK